ncbi:MAG: CDP-alcohol phosphatidyltransferase family protein [Porphyromonadaceae bacterium]|nr:CDP-alcohol phosphatidyltransferase family protein [Porphyromonadaceae bacterium]
MNYRDYLQQLIYKIINPVVKGFIKVGITPNFITSTGLILNIVAAILFIYAGYAASERLFFYVGLGGAVVLFAGLFDMFDGRVARLGNMVSRFGAFYDSVCDRYSELFTLFGLVFFLFLQGYVAWAIVTFVALIGSIMVSYVRARAEGLGLACKVGLMQRPERIVLTSLGALCYGIFGRFASSFDPILILVVPLALIAVLANVTAFVRVAHCRRLLKNNN